MIQKTGQVFHLSTRNTSYCFRIMETGHLEQLHYGSRIDTEQGIEAIYGKHAFAPGCSISYDKEHKNLSMEDICLEVSSVGKGDVREPLIDLIHADGTRTCDFVYESDEIIEGKYSLKALPSSYYEGMTSSYYEGMTSSYSASMNSPVMSLIIHMKDKNSALKLDLLYAVFEDCNIITRSLRLINQEPDDIRLLRVLSAQLDLDSSNHIMTSFHGTWAREMGEVRRQTAPGLLVNDSKTGFSSNRCNPFFMLSELEAGETHGECYGFNLVYSGNHYEAVEVTPYDKTRIIWGINPSQFEWILPAGAEFEAPEAVMTFSGKGFEGLSQNMHQFIREHIVRGSWKKKERPILVNSWESFYFKFDEGKLMKLAKTAKELGAELFVLDDGWFGKRNDDTSSLGDWTVNKEKLPHGLKGLSQKINSLGMDFGIWVEPEMVNEDSDCFRKHPDWAVLNAIRSNLNEGVSHSVGRNQILLDLTRKEVRAYVIDSMRHVFSSGKISYVKWDMNRNFSDVKCDMNRNFSDIKAEAGIDSHRTAMSFAHRYMLGLYEVLETLTKEFPHILFESCASGGNRFDLGMLCFMPQIWASDNSDAISRAQIQQGYSYGYPLSVLGAHVSGCPNHQTLRNTSLETRFNVAAFGLLGYECNLSELTTEEKEKVKKQILFYKKHRYSLQFGQFTRLKHTENEYQWMLYEQETGGGILLYLQKELIPNQPHDKLRIRNLEMDKSYHFYNYKSTFHIKEFGDLINMITPVHVKRNSLLHTCIDRFKPMEYETEEYTCKGSLLCNSGIRLKDGFCGIGYDENTRHMPDFSSRLYVIEEC